MLALKMGLSLDRLVYKRRIYSAIDLLTDIGGFGAIIFAFIGALMACGSKNKAEKYLQE